VHYSFKMGKTVYCISNGSQEMFPDNTLTSFGNKFPFMYDYGQESNSYKLQVAVDAIGFSLNFNQQFLPDPMENPCMIFEYEKNRLVPSLGYTLNKNKIESSTFPLTEEDLKMKKKDEVLKPSYLFLHIENSVLTMKSVTSLMNRLDNILYVKDNADLNTITLAFRYKNVNVYFNSKLFPFIKVYVPNLEVATIKSVSINNDVYEIYTCKNNFNITMDFNGVFSLNLPKIIKVRCKNIRDQIFNNTHEKDLLVFCPQIDKQLDTNENYFFHDFESRTYCTFENTILDRINFELVNEYNEALHLSTGVPTLLKLDIIAMEKSKKAFNVRVASDIHNRSKFSIKLPQTLHFNEHWRVNLSSINLPNTFNTFNVEEPLTIIFKYQVGGFKWGTQGSFVTDGKIELNIPNKIYTKKELLELINLFLKSNPTGINVGEIEEVTTGEHKITTKLVLRSHGLLCLPKVLTDMLGKCDHETYVDENNYVCFMHGHQAIEEAKPTPVVTTTYEFEGPLNIDYYKPSYIMLYSDFIQPIAVSGIYMNIMKIFPTSPLKIPYVIKEFKKTEYLQLNNYEIKEMSFQLRNHAGEFINFDSDNHNPVILNLHFSNYPNT